MEAEALGCGGEGGSPRGEGCRAAPPGAVSNGSDAESGQELVELRVIWNKNKYDVKFRLDSTGADLKQKIHSLTGAWGGPQAPSRPPPPDPPVPPRPAARHAEGDVQGAAARGEDAARDQSHQRCQDHGGGLHHQRRAGCQHAQGCGAARGEGGGEQEGAALQAEGTGVPGTGGGRLGGTACCLCHAACPPVVEGPGGAVWSPRGCKQSKRFMLLAQAKPTSIISHS